MAYFWMGEGTHKVPMTMHRNHRVNLADKLREQLGDAAGGAFAWFKGGSEQNVYDTDTNWAFRQESNFQYLFGVKEPGLFGCVEVASGRGTLFIPRLPKEHAKWMGPIKPPVWFKDTYEVDTVFYVEQIPEKMKDFGASKLLVYCGENRDSGLTLESPDFTGIDTFEVDRSDLLWNTLAELRVIKDADEIAIMDFVCEVSSLSHIGVMRKAAAPPRAGGKRRFMMEYMSEAEFRYEAMCRGCARTGYNCIAPSGDRAAILHYGHSAEPNSQAVLDGQMKLHDMGAEYHVYSSDVTCTFPADGTFTEPQRIVYNAVWQAVVEVEAIIKPGVNYKDMHRLAERVLLTKMKEAGLFVGEVSDMEKVYLANYFMPHGLGHCLGLDVHDVGGYPPGQGKCTEKGLASLRCGRDLMENMVITVEPGFYFISYLIDEALATEETKIFIDKAKLEHFRSVGGVRIEDDVLITADGCRVLSHVPRTVEDIESVIAGGEWDSAKREYHNNIDIPPTRTDSSLA